MKFIEILKLVQKDIDKVDYVMRKYMKSNIPLISKVSRYIINTQGKKIRPIIILLLAKIFQYKGNEHIKLAALVEFIHTATLIHDDIIDHSSFRRGKETVNKIFGTSIGILIGDLIYTKAFQIIYSIKSLKILKLISDAAFNIVEGEILQIENYKNLDITVQNYIKIVYKKTACLFEVCSQSVKIFRKIDKKQNKNLKNYGKNLGIAFQIIDDLSDYFSTKKVLGKQIGNDFIEGKITLPLIHCIKNCNMKQFHTIKKSMQNKKKNFLYEITSIMKEHNSFEFTKNFAKKKVQLATKNLNFLPNSVYKKALKSLGKYILDKNF
ncbi:polyprenyl synthetase family protein [bacterium endosymbiont of Pedicinus badii]|uniref:polyprenyl synthetase family protein n=1 Tax=bacterium endosymbiont of Pedicinus badii TaxID=1719126 RepID=UPI0009BB7027|nr:polyprenyl synthetase family protein [bacterium endosymbiont of Pedicinus badii]OQM34183.1 hypothetical protein AOQ89_02500 [bacterium endosymbiont of Pedicinus badii]